ncbi:DUF2953 domain-containing protein [Alkalicoccobacillus murimartini]|uniref:DUF2953 domain-containing protein n=1 Tax=Alkalicoccobacillus murimartini TaxID=171685 RepID=A0ABT9YKK6_9BACI|nr:DUF2953 domain-containing protein [Alkalicoccobacillus murimartini]MDQ0208123.1 hypothetical protein [Alkalicoccobacillus murimartini]
MTWLIITFIVCVILICVWFVRMKIDLYYAYLHKEQKLKMKVTIFSFTIYSYTVPSVKVGEDGVVMKEQTKSTTSTKRKKKRLSLMEFFQHFQQTQEWISYLIRLHVSVHPMLKNIKVHNVQWNTEFGLHDAAYTAQATGYIWSIKGTLFGLLSQYVTMKKLPVLAVAPMYQKNVAHTELTCMFSFRVGHAIYAGITVLRHWRQRPRPLQQQNVQAKQT